MQTDSQLVDKALQPIHHGLSGFDRRSQQWPSDGHDVCAIVDHSAERSEALRRYRSMN
jgi:hypothetical protein